MTTPTVLTEERVKLIRDHYLAPYQGPPEVVQLNVELAALADHWLRTQWQPIATAPKDGTEIFAYWGKWRTESGMEIDSNCYGTTLYQKGEWINPDDADDEYRAPTYWMPLPPPPQEPA